MSLNLSGFGNCWQTDLYYMFLHHARSSCTKQRETNEALPRGYIELSRSGAWVSYRTPNERSSDGFMCFSDNLVAKPANQWSNLLDRDNAQVMSLEHWFASWWVKVKAQETVWNRRRMDTREPFGVPEKPGDPAAAFKSRLTSELRKAEMREREISEFVNSDPTALTVYRKVEVLRRDKPDLVETQHRVRDVFTLFEQEKAAFATRIAEYEAALAELREIEAHNAAISWLKTDVENTVREMHAVIARALVEHRNGW